MIELKQEINALCALVAALIDAFGLFDSEKIKFSLNHVLGIAIMIVGIIIFKWNH